MYRFVKSSTQMQLLDFQRSRNKDKFLIDCTNTSETMFILNRDRRHETFSNILNKYTSIRQDELYTELIIDVT